jgi:hypothetical protein
LTTYELELKMGSGFVTQEHVLPKHFSSPALTLNQVTSGLAMAALVEGLVDWAKNFK